MLAERIKELRKRAGLTQAALAQTVGLSQQAIGKWETGYSAPDPEMIAFLARLFHVSADYLLGCIPEEASLESEASEPQIPIIGTVKAGYNALAFEEEHGAEPATVNNPEEYFYLIVRGSSMEPRIANGDLALVHQQPDVENGELAVVLVDGEEGTLKKIIKEDNAVILQPFNPKYEPLVFMGEEINRLTIVGKVVETRSKW